MSMTLRNLLPRNLPMQSTRHLTLTHESTTISLTLRTVRSIYIMYLDRRPHPPNLNSEPHPRPKLLIEPLPAERAHVAPVWLLRQKKIRFFISFHFFSFSINFSAPPTRVLFFNFVISKIWRYFPPKN